MSRFTIDNRSSLPDQQALFAFAQTVRDVLTSEFSTASRDWLGRRITITRRNNPKVDTFRIEDAK